MRYFTGKLESVSDILWMIVGNIKLEGKKSEEWNRRMRRKKHDIFTIVRQGYQVL